MLGQRITLAAAAAAKAADSCCAPRGRGVGRGGCCAVDSAASCKAERLHIRECVCLRFTYDQFEVVPCPLPPATLPESDRINSNSSLSSTRIHVEQSSYFTRPTGSTGTDTSAARISNWKVSLPHPRLLLSDDWRWYNCSRWKREQAAFPAFKKNSHNTTFRWF